MRLPLRCAAVVAPAAALLALLPAPARAMDPLLDCAVTLVNAAAGASTWCATSALPPMGNNTFGPYRTVWVLAETGSARADLSCPYATIAVAATAPAFEDGGAWGGEPCRLTLTALTNGTTAQAASIGSYVMVLP